MVGSLIRGALLLAFAGAASIPLEARSLLNYVGQCVPFARAASGVQIYGDAWTWWDQAAGRYPRGQQPKVGAVLAFAKTSRLPLGHVLVISRVVDPRVAMVTHANWSRINGVRGGVEQDVTVFDVSRNGDWTRVKVWYRDTQGLGSSEYPTHGFIYGPSPAAGLSSAHPDYVGSLIDAYAR
ncbi:MULTISPECIES: CHAP domain-containing protein [unclassified Sphingomonas]|uniref:CHAP domain-containing protein n=1 Tax=unclassified Sphingomonas TaxID=196159 RepID=UPI0006F9E303|nr:MULTISPECIES: CHAP domain-containing protein [unclassified Sphingomonas]KQM98104.1 amidase [Sphingomonas sp. Leaf25]KQN37707.1 amidase [Sphingomonas sp. Leaf42]KQT28074.1 amidase [Sphingomonas sp. Leaf407]